MGRENHSQRGQYPPEDWLNDLEPFDDTGCGPRVPDGVGDTPYDYWNLFVTDDILATFVRQTNLYGARKRGNSWQATNSDEDFLQSSCLWALIGCRVERCTAEVNVLSTKKPH